MRHHRPSVKTIGQPGRQSPRCGSPTRRSANVWSVARGGSACARRLHLAHPARKQRAHPGPWCRSRMAVQPRGSSAQSNGLQTPEFAFRLSGLLDRAHERADKVEQRVDAADADRRALGGAGRAGAGGRAGDERQGRRVGRDARRPRGKLSWSPASVSVLDVLRDRIELRRPRSPLPRLPRNRGATRLRRRRTRPRRCGGPTMPGRRAGPVARLEGGVAGRITCYDKSSA